MPQVQLIIDLVTPDVGRRRAERIVALPGVPGVGEFIDTIPGPTLALAVTAVRWQAVEGTVTLFLGAARGSVPVSPTTTANSNSQATWSKTSSRPVGTLASTSEALGLGREAGRIRGTRNGA